MKSLIVLLVATVLCYHAAQAVDCSTDPCQLVGYFSQANGYQCVPLGTDVLCTCPNSLGFETNRPCRVCNRTTGVNPCGTSIGTVCLESNTISPPSPFACICNGAPPTATPCDNGTTSPCSNGGVVTSGICQCPSGFSGPTCAVSTPADLCNYIVCMNNGHCAVRNPDGTLNGPPWASTCLCPLGYWGDYCQLIGTAGFCSGGSCMNSAPCKERVIGSSRYAYCDCPPGYNGVRCEKQYFKCNSTGNFLDPYMAYQGKYLSCTQATASGPFTLVQRSCPKGLRYNTMARGCVVV